MSMAIRTEDTDPETLIDPEIRAEIGDPVPIAFAARLVYLPILVVSAGCAFFVLETIPGANLTPGHVLEDLGIGAGVAIAMVFVTWVLGRCLHSLQELEHEFRKILGDLDTRTIIGLALLSGAAEETLFRGCLQPWLGYVATSVLFGCLHFVPSRVFLPWTLFALASGFVFGGLFSWRGNLIAPTVAHMLVNGINLHLIVTGRRVPSRDA